LRIFGRILLSVLLIGGIAYAIFGDIHVGPSADAQKPVVLACLRRAGFNVTDEVPTRAFTSLYPSDGRDVQWELYVKDKNGARVAVMYLADLSGDLDDFADHLKDNQRTYGDYKGEAIEHRGTTVIRLAKSYARAGAIHACVDQAAKAKET
jgi:hypothetical protein